jgi:SRSO17 transposase
LDAGVPTSFVTGDEVYGADPTLRAALEQRRVGYVMAVACNHRVPVASGSERADEIAAGLPQRSWQQRSAGNGTKGPRWYSWALVKISTDEPGHHWLLIRRNDTTGEIAYYRCYSPTPVNLTALVRVAGQRWKVEESFQTAKGQAGLDEHQVRRWCSWHRWSTLAMLAMAFLAVTTAAQRQQDTMSDDRIPITVNELRRLFDALILGRIATVEHILKWSDWRRKHQATARRCHYHRRSEPPRLELLL